MTQRNPTMFNANRLKLGIFAANCSSGTAVTTVPERWDASWESNLELARTADAAGFEFMLPIARWRGYGGATNFQGETLETITWASGLLSGTDNITVFGTVHAPLLHPVIAAKQMVTVDHIGRGRFGLNIVCGWNQDEFDMFAVEQRPHDDRYAYGQEWWDVVRGLWETEGPFDHDGRYLQLQNLQGDPKPYGGRRPVVMNAGASEAGLAFAARNCDVLFTALVDYDRTAKAIQKINERARGFGRTVDIYCSTHLVCRPTRREAEEFYRYYAVENADTDAVERLMELQGLHAQSFPAELIEQSRTRFAGGHGSYPIVGTPDDVATEYERISKLGVAGATIAAVDYLDAVAVFRDEVMPRLERMGLREPANSGI
jgi:alkanesulfonate monooxygenase SsuD/methylene tetrahydromethanopterin reductase-like flavin-dependent oxidoreductase (luciferase family)